MSEEELKKSYDRQFFKYIDLEKKCNNFVVDNLLYGVNFHYVVLDEIAHINEINEVKND